MLWGLFIYNFGYMQNVKMTLFWHLKILEDFYYSPCPCGQSKDAPMVPSILSTWDFNVQHSFFKLTTKSNVTQAIMEVVALAVDKINPIFAKPFTQLWWVIHASQLLSQYFPKYLKLVEIARVHIFGSIDDERCFSSIFFLKNKLCNHLNSHL